MRLKCTKKKKKVLVRFLVPFRNGHGDDESRGKGLGSLSAGGCVDLFDFVFRVRNAAVDRKSGRVRLVAVRDRPPSAETIAGRGFSSYFIAPLFLFVIIYFVLLFIETCAVVKERPLRIIGACH